MVNKLLEELYGEYVALLRQLNKKQGKLIERLSEELKVKEDSISRLSQTCQDLGGILDKYKDRFVKQDEQIIGLEKQVTALKAQITEESTARLAAIKKEMAEQNQVIQELAQEKLERGKEIAKLKSERDTEQRERGERQ